MATDSGGLSRKQTRAIAALLTERTQADAARAAGIGTRTIERWLADPDFKRELRKAQSELLADELAKIGRMIGKSYTTLDDLLSDPDSSIRLRAAALIVDQAGAIFDLVALERRLQELEARYAPRDDYPY